MHFEEAKLLSEQILIEVKGTHPTLILQEVIEFLLYKKDYTEVRLKINRSETYKEYTKKRFKEFLATKNSIDKKSIFFSFDNSKYELSQEEKVYVTYKNKRINEIYFNKKADNVFEIFGEENSRLAEKLIETLELDLKDFIFKNDGRGKIIF